MQSKYYILHYKYYHSFWKQHGRYCNWTYCSLLRNTHNGCQTKFKQIPVTGQKLLPVWCLSSHCQQFLICWLSVCLRQSPTPVSFWSLHLAIFRFSFERRGMNAEVIVRTVLMSRRPTGAYGTSKWSRNCVRCFAFTGHSTGSSRFKLKFDPKFGRDLFASS
jgi:hypothetical protein